MDGFIQASASVFIKAPDVTGWLTPKAGSDNTVPVWTEQLLITK